MKKQIIAFTCMIALLISSITNGFSVQAAKKTVTLNKKNLTLKVGETKKLNVKKTAKIKMKSKIFTSSNKDVATVTKKTGKIIAKKPGKATITVKIKYSLRPKKRNKTMTLKCKVKVIGNNTATSKPGEVSVTASPVSEAPQETPIVTPQETPIVTPQETPIVTPQETPIVTPQETPIVTPQETPLPADRNEYNAYLGFTTDNWAYRDPWNNDKTGLDSEYYNYKSQIALSYKAEMISIDVEVEDAKIKQGMTEYKLSISDVDLKTLKADDVDAPTAEKFYLLFISTDIPLSMQGVRCTNATLTMDGETIKTYDMLPCKGDAMGYYQFMLADIFAPLDGTIGCAFMKDNPLTILPSNSIEITFTLEGIDFAKQYN